MVLMYNGELGVINSSELFHAKKLQKKVTYSLVSLFYFLARYGGRLPHKSLGLCFLYSPK